MISNGVWAKHNQPRLLGFLKNATVKQNSLKKEGLFEPYDPL